MWRGVRAVPAWPSRSLAGDVWFRASGSTGVLTSSPPSGLLWCQQGTPTPAISTTMLANSRTTHRRQQSGTTSEKSDPSVEGFISWLRDSGAKFDKVQIVSLGADMGWGLAAREDIRAGEQVVKLPAPLLLSYDDRSGDTSAALLALIARVPPELWGFRLGLKLLEERARGDTSFWAQYVRLLPAVFQGVPIFFGPESVKALQYPPLAAQIAKRARFLHDFSTELKAIRGTPADPYRVDVDVGALGWAFASVSSRAFRVQGPDLPAAMLPLIDIANHSFENNCATEVDGRGGISMMAKVDISAGSALLLNYGNMPNDHLLLDYGFVAAPNVFDTVPLTFGPALLDNSRVAAHLLFEPFTDLPQMEPWQRAKLEALQLTGASANLEVHLGGKGLVDGRLLAALRVLYATNPQMATTVLDTPLDTLKDLERGADVLSKQSEAHVLRTLAGATAVALNSFPTTLSADETDLATRKGSGGELLALQLRLGKKRVLGDVLRRLARRLQPPPVP